MKKKYFLMNFVAVAILILTGCSKSESLQSLQVKSEDYSSLDYKDLVSRMGFDTTNIIKKGDTIIVEGDITLYEHMLRVLPKTLPRQATVHDQMMIYEENLKVYINPFFGVFKTYDIRAGLEEFHESNFSTGQGVQSFTYVANESEADIVIQYYSENSGTCGYADFPTIDVLVFPYKPKVYFKIGRHMYLNLTNINSMTPSELKFLVAHEFGHMIGLRHTNWRGSESEFGYYNGVQIGAYTIGGTTNSTANPDPNSVFNSFTCGNSWTGFTNWDIKAINTQFNLPPP